MMARLLEKYRHEIVPYFQENLHYRNRLAVPRLEKIIVSMGVGKATENKDRIEAAIKDLTLIAGQRAIVTKARKSVSGFKVRKNDRIGCKVTLRGKRMYEFLDRLISIVIPRLRDFRGFDRRSFDQGGNFNLGISEQTVFPEINIDQVQFVQGMDITLVIRSKSVDASYELLKQFGMPFRN